MRYFFTTFLLVALTRGFGQENKENIIKNYEKVVFYENGLIKEASKKSDSLLNNYTIRFNESGDIVSITEFAKGKIKHVCYRDSFYAVKYKRKKPVYQGGMPGCGTGRLEYGKFLERLYNEVTSK